MINEYGEETCCVYLRIIFHVRHYLNQRYYALNDMTKPILNTLLQGFHFQLMDMKANDI